MNMGIFGVCVSNVIVNIIWGISSIIVSNNSGITIGGISDVFMGFFWVLWNFLKYSLFFLKRILEGFGFCRDRIIVSRIGGIISIIFRSIRVISVGGICQKYRGFGVWGDFEIFIVVSQ